MFASIQNLFTTYNDKIFRILLIISIALLLSAIVEYLFKSWGKRVPTKRAQTVLSVLLNIIRVVIFISALLLVLSAVSVNVTPFLASAGILGLAVGFGSQLLIRDLITGIFLILENQFNAGDRVKIDTIEGVVDHVGLRTISVRDDSGAMHIIPNGSVTKIANLSKSWSQANITITVALKNDMDKVKAILESTAKELERQDDTLRHILKPAEVFALEDLSDKGMTFKVQIRCDCDHAENVGRTFRYLLKKNFDREKIAIV